MSHGSGILLRRTPACSRVAGCRCGVFSSLRILSRHHAAGPWAAGSCLRLRLAICLGTPCHIAETKGAMLVVVQVLWGAIYYMGMGVEAVRALGGAG